MNKRNSEKSVSRSGDKLRLQIRDMVMVSLCSAIIAVSAQITIPTTVPFTLQTLAVFFFFVLLGMKKGTISVLIYVLLGAAGLPVFAGFKSGVISIIGPTGGYIIGFIATAAIVGFFRDRFGSKLWISMISMAIGLLVCYSFGTIWFTVVYNSTEGGIDLVKVLQLCVLPFLLADAVKIVIAAIISNRINAIVKH